GGDGAREHTAAGGLLAAAARDNAIVEMADGQLFHRPLRQLLLAHRRAIAWKLVEHARVLGGDEHAEVFVGGVLGDFERCEYSHDDLVQDEWFPDSCSGGSMKPA